MFPTRCFCMIVSAILLIPATASNLHADIYRWDTGELIPGTEGIEPGPGVDLSQMEWRMQLWLKEILQAQLKSSNLTNALLSYSTLGGANFVEAVVVGAILSQVTEWGFTSEQLSIRPRATKGRT